MLENIRLSFQGIWAHKLRSLLTMLGIIIGIAAIIAIVSTIKGTNEQIKENLVGAGDNTVTVQLYQDDWAYDAAELGIPEGIPLIDDAVIKKITSYNEIKSATKFYSSQIWTGVYYKNNSLASGYLQGIDNTYFDTAGYVIKNGRSFTKDDIKYYRKVAIIDSTTADTLFIKGNAIGQTIEIKNEPFVIVGIADKSKEFEPVINSIDDYYTYMGQSGGYVFVPNSIWPTIYGYDMPENILIKANTTDDMSTAGKECADYLNSLITAENTTVKYQAQDLLKQAKELQELSNATNQQLIWIASISLIVGGIGVMNIMLVSVTERTSEIGLKKAIGARKGQILAQFLTEAAVLTSLGGLIGVIAGIALAKVISQVSETPVSISIPAAVLGVVFSMIIGIVFGLLPSYKAANLNPIEALRHE